MHVRSLLAISLLASSASAQSIPETLTGGPTAEETDDLFSWENLLYRQDDRGGNPNLDEDASIYETIILVDNRLTETDTLHLRALIDVISAASYDAVQNSAENTGATGINPGRLGTEIGWTRDLGPWSWNLHTSFDQELYYRAFGVGGSVARSMFEDNTQVSLNLQTYQDLIRTVRFDGTVEPDEDRDTFTAELGVDQILSPVSRLNVSATVTQQEGLLSTSFNSVLLNGSPAIEVLPRERERVALATRYKHALFDDEAIEVGYRYYDDDWGIQAHTVELRYFTHAGERLLVEPNYRYYDQTGADYFATAFTGMPAFLTSDSDLGDFTGHLFGVDLTFLDRRWWGRVGDLGLGANYYDRSDGLDLFWITFGWSFRF